MVNINKLVSRYKKDSTIIYQLSVEDLSNLITHAKSLYYRSDSSEESFMTDQQYDAAEEQLRELDPDHPLLSQVDAPGKKEAVKLPYWLSSLDKIKDEKAVSKWLTQHPGTSLIMEKLDGASNLLTKDEYGTIKLYSRGENGMGFDISYLLPHLTSLQGVDFDAIDGSFAARGEIIISKQNYDKFGIVDVAKKNPRPISTGLINSENPDKELLSYLSFVVYEQIYPQITINKGLRNLSKLGFEVVRSMKVKNSDLGFSYLQQTLISWRKESNFIMDGLVIFHDTSYERIWGKKYPTYAVAFKDPDQMEKKEVVVTEVRWRCSKDGYLKPRVFYEPVRLGGDMCNKASAHNAKYVEENEIGPNSRIVVMRSGDIIPYVCKVISPSPSGADMPEQEYEWVKSGTMVDIRVTEERSQEQLISSLVHFSTKMEIEGLKEGKIRKLVENNIISSIACLWKLNKKKLSALVNVGWGEKSTTNLLEALKVMKEKRDLSRLMAATNICRGLSEKSLELIIGNCSKLYDSDAANTITVDELLEIKGIGKIKAKDFLAGLPEFQDFLLAVGLALEDFAPDNASSCPHKNTGQEERLAGHTIVFTGVRPKEDMKHKIKQLGGKITTAISRNTTIVVANLEKAGQKLKEAEELGISIMSIEQFEQEYL